MTAAGCPTSFDLADSDRLGLQIVRTLVEGELGGRLTHRRATGGGTVVTIDVGEASAAPRPRTWMRLSALGVAVLASIEDCADQEERADRERGEQRAGGPAGSARP